MLTPEALEDFEPEGPFGLYIFAMVGPAGGQGEESFGMMLCTPEWFEQNMKDSIAMGRHHLFVKKYNYLELKQFLTRYCDGCTGDSWGEVAAKVARIGHWEFEDYAPSPHTGR